MPLDKLIVLFFVFGGGFWVLRPLANALAHRISRRDEPPVSGMSEEVLDELRAVRREVAELAERVDFTERLLAQNREGQRLAPPKGA